MIFRQITHDDLGCASYLIGDEKAGVAAVADPKLEIDEYLEMARYMGVEIAHVLETHNHADHLSGHGRLAAATGATIRIHKEAAAEYEHEPFEDGDEIVLGDVVVTAIHTPGHRPEHTAFALTDLSRGEEPWAVLTGDSLFVGDIARPDLAVEKHEGARAIFRSLHEKLLVLPGECEVWPAHVGGSMCGGPGMDMKTSSTIGYERAHSDLLAVTDEDEFVRRALADLGPQPPNLEAIVRLNRGALTTWGVDVLPLAPRQVDLKRDEGALLVDVRTDPQFDDAHIPDAICIPMHGAGFGSRLAWLADREQEIVFVGRDDADGRYAARLAMSVGLHELAGFLHGGMTSWRQEKRPIKRMERIELDDLPERMKDAQLQILDVRSRAEWDARHIPGSAFTPWHDIDAVPDGIDPARPVAVLCASGQRAAVAASLLQRQGAGRVLHVTEGGVPRWEALGHPIERSRDAVVAS